MEIKETKDHFFAIISIGLKRGYTERLIAIDEILLYLSKLQDELVKGKGIYLSANCSESVVVLSGQKEAHLNIKFINYPRFPLSRAVFNELVVDIATRLLMKFEQNRLVIEFDDGFSMLQQKNSIDPNILS